jgi:cytochrome c-type biogenesis protein CcmH/NrfG
LCFACKGTWTERRHSPRKTIELDPLDGFRHRELGVIQMGQGRYKEALESFMTAKQLTGNNLVLDQGLAYALLANDRVPEAIAQAQRAIAEWPPEGGPDAEVPWLVLIAAESEDGQDAQARADLQNYLATPRTFRTIAEIQRSGLLHFATIRPLLDGLRRAGMPAG